jgi:hypothetical protein
VSPVALAGLQGPLPLPCQIKHTGHENKESTRAPKHRRGVDGGAEKGGGNYVLDLGVPGKASMVKVKAPRAIVQESDAWEYRLVKQVVGQRIDGKGYHK